MLVASSSMADRRVRLGAAYQPNPTDNAPAHAIVDLAADAAKLLPEQLNFFSEFRRWTFGIGRSTFSEK